MRGMAAHRQGWPDRHPRRQRQQPRGGAGSALDDLDGDTVAERKSACPTYIDWANVSGRAGYLTGCGHAQHFLCRCAGKRFDEVAEPSAKGMPTTSVPIIQCARVCTACLKT